MAEKIRVINALDDRELYVTPKAFAQGAYPGYELADDSDAELVDALAPARPAVQQQRTSELSTRDDVASTTPAPPAVVPAPEPVLVEATVDVDELDLDDLKQHLDLHPEERAALLAAEHDGQARPELLELLEVTSGESTQAAATVNVGDLTANQVFDHLAGHPEERAALLEAEVAGKARKTVVAALQPPAPEES